MTPSLIDKLIEAILIQLFICLYIYFVYKFCGPFDSGYFILLYMIFKEITYSLLK